MGPMELIPFQRKSYSGLLHSEKIHRPQPSLNPRTSDPVASMITSGPPGSTDVLDMLLLLAFTTLLNVLGNSVASDIEREKAEKFCSEALISA